MSKTQGYTLKDVALKIKNVIVTNSQIDIEDYITELARESGIRIHDIGNLYNDMYSIYNSEIDASSKRRNWTYNEDSFIICYTDICKRLEPTKPLSEAIKDIAELLVGRSDMSISFRYYNVLKPKNTPSKDDVVADDLEEVQEEPHTELESPKTEDKADLLDVVIEIVDNMEKANADVLELFSGILNLSRMAIDNSKQKEIKDLEEQLDSKRSENTMLKSELKEISKDLVILRREFENFNKMSGEEKIRNIYKFNNSVKYVVDKFGNVYLK